MGERIKRLVAYYKRLYKTDDPYELADYLHIVLIRRPLGTLAGCYMYMKKNKVIFLNSELPDDNFARIVMAHELGHAVLHPRENCYFMKHKTLLLTSKIERQANLFAAEWLISDEMLKDYEGCTVTVEQFARCRGVHEDLVRLKLELNNEYNKNRELPV